MQQIQDYLIAVIQNIRIVLRHARLNLAVSLAEPVSGLLDRYFSVFSVISPAIVARLNEFPFALLPD